MRLTSQQATQRLLRSSSVRKKLQHLMHSFEPLTCSVNRSATSTLSRLSQAPYSKGMLYSIDCRWELASLQH